MSEINIQNEYAVLYFESISDFKWCMHCGGEVVFVWKNKRYCAFGKLLDEKTSQIRMFIGEACNKKDGEYYNPENNELFDPCNDYWADTADEILQYNVGGDRLRDVITEVKVLERTV